MSWTPWNMFVDVCFIAVLLMFAQILRAKIKIIQKLNLPAPLIAGILSWVLGPNCVGLIPYSTNLATYASILIVLLFGSAPLGKPKRSIKNVGRDVLNMGLFTEISILGQHGLSMLLCMLVLVPLFDVPHMFGYIIPAGWAGGPATALAAGTIFEDMAGWSAGIPLGLLSYTLGISFGVVGGVAIINYARKKGYTKFVKGTGDDLPEEMVTGMIRKEKQGPLGKETVSSSTLDSLTLHLALVLLVGIVAYYISKLVSYIFKGFSFPAFAAAVLVGYLIQAIIRGVRAEQYVDEKTIGHISNTCTDIMVVASITAIEPTAVVTYAVPLLISTLICGVGYCLWVVFFLGPRIVEKAWFEKSIFTYGWLTGVIATSMVLLRMIDPELKSNALEDWSLAYLPLSFSDIFCVTVVPVMLANNMGLQWTALACGVFILLLLISKKLGFWYKHGAQRDKEEAMAHSGAE